MQPPSFPAVPTGVSGETADLVLESFNLDTNVFDLGHMTSKHLLHLLHELNRLCVQRIRRHSSSSPVFVGFNPHCVSEASPSSRSQQLAGFNRLVGVSDNRFLFSKKASSVLNSLGGRSAVTHNVTLTATGRLLPSTRRGRAPSRAPRCESAGGKLCSCLPVHHQSGSGIPARCVVPIEAINRVTC